MNSNPEPPSWIQVTDLAPFEKERVVFLSEHETATLNSIGSPDEPGWYRDPLKPGAIRFFDGSLWTGRIRRRNADVDIAAGPTDQFLAQPADDSASLSISAEVLEAYQPERVFILTDGEKYALARSSAPPTSGWYPDPLATDTARYWSGSEWTGRVRRLIGGQPRPLVTGQPQAATPGHTSIAYRRRPASWRRERNRAMTDALRGMSKKYRLALEGDRYGTFSVLGTDSWQEYASATLQAMLLETMTDLAEQSDARDERLARIEALLTEIRDALTRPTDP